MSYRSPRQSLSKAYLKSPVSRPEIEQFKTAFVKMQNKIDTDNTEEHLKNNIRDFLLDAYYKGDYEINVKDRTDLVIHNGPKSTDAVGVIIEAKSVKNTAEMISRSELNKKALRELILYYLREREDEKNINVKHLIITNAVEWFVFDENDFEKLIFRNAKFLKQYKEYKSSGKDTKHFYDAIAKPFIETIKEDLSYAYFDVSKYQKVITNTDEKDDVKLVALYKLLSPIHILKKPFSNDSNSLNKDFYNELLHIIGLEEVKEKNKKVIQRKPEDKREPASLVENTINILKYETNVAESKRYETALELCITWINRILFLKLLESQLIKYQKGDKNYEFLNYEKVSDYDTLNRLFFQVLAIKPEDRRPKIKDEYVNVPYLNSSLFEVNTLESNTLRISSLEDSNVLSIYSKTVLTAGKGKRASGTINTLQYLFEFLAAYNFSSEGGEQIQEESKSLINASVLGLIFEKINGYKDGSFFTPGFITMYMCKETIRRAVIQKFKDHTDFDSEDWDELKNFIGRPYKKDELKKYNELIDSLKICDPAVGSGHFLVSALNEIIAIKSELGILWDGNSSKLPVLASVDNDELIFENDNEEHDLYEYDYTSSSSRAIQKAIFEEKQKLIENCLFGVDINPNSVKICRLRLWIELLKNAYYTEESNYTDLETLPNIDINIKCGNSLISRFDLDSDLKPALKKSKFSLDSYKAAVASYKVATNKEAKQEFKRLIEGIKNDFRSEVRSKELLDLQRLEGQFYERFGQATLIDVELSKSEAKKKKKEQEKLMAKIDKKKKDIEEVRNNRIYENAFEWRFEFPEVLNDNGGYEGFDAVIGNPPYIHSRENFSEDEKSYLYRSYKAIDYQINLYVLFIEKSSEILKNDGFYAMIIPNSLLMVSSTTKIREFLLNEGTLCQVVSLLGESFEGVNVETSIIIGQKANKLDFLDVYMNEGTNIKFHYSKNLARILSSEDFSLNIYSDDETDLLIDRLAFNSYKLDEIVSIKAGLQAYEVGKGNPPQTRDDVTNRIYDRKYKVDENTYPYLNGRDVQRYKILPHSEYLLYGDNLAAPRQISIFQSPKIIIREITGTYPQSIIAAYTEECVLFNRSNIAINGKGNKFNLKCILGLLNSKLMSFYFKLNTAKAVRKMFPKVILKDLRNFPIKDMSQHQIDEITSKVDQIIELKNEERITDQIEFEIDLITYKIYGLTYQEVVIIDPDFRMSEIQFKSFNISD
ncbi:MAG: TaqI-like C-terminal specificity domain-containing protein [Bacteroidota bacterium]